MVLGNPIGTDPQTVHPWPVICGARTAMSEPNIPPAGTLCKNAQMKPLQAMSSPLLKKRLWSNATGNAIHDIVGPTTAGEKALKRTPTVNPKTVNSGSKHERGANK